MKRLSRALILLFILLSPIFSYAVDPITGTFSVCAGSNTTLANATAGGTWSSSDGTIASIGSASGTVTGVMAGTAEITYTFPTTGFVTQVVTVNATPSPIGGVMSICNTQLTTLTDTVAGGTWSSTSTRVTVGSATGVVTGTSTGTAVVTYTLPGGCRTTTIVTVNLNPSTLTGTMNVCVGLTRTFTNTVSGGTWSSTNTAAATFGTASVGTVMGVAADTTTIKYTLSNGCFVSTNFTVNPSPGPIVGTFVQCVGTTTPLTDTLPGGIWSSSNITVAAMGTSSGIFHANFAGTATITYKTTGNCISTQRVTVNASPATITGTRVVCAGGTTQLFNSVSLGNWQSADTSIAVLVTPTGLVGGVSAGTTTVSYVLINGCYKTAVVTVNPLPDSITGVTQVCTSMTITLASATAGGTWSSNDILKATIGSGTGLVTGVNAGTVVITYRLPTSCRRTYIVTVDPTPAAISGSLAICEGATTNLTTTSTGGSWVSSSTSTATIASAAGVVTGIASGTTNISYINFTHGCYTSSVLTVNPLPSAVLGAATVCVSDTVMLSSAAAGGTWTSGTTSIATAGAATGIITGVMAGITNITYRLPTGCAAYRLMTVNPLPSAGVVTGPGSVCETGTATLVASVTGGTWSSAFGLVSVSGAGVVTGLGGGNDTIHYNVTDACGVGVAIFPIIINPLPDTALISGDPNICIGSTTNLSTSFGGGIWSNSSTTAAIVSPTGVVSGIALGTGIISYTRTNVCGSSVATVVVTVHALVDPGSIIGKDTTCMGDSIALHGTVAGGMWVSTAPWIAKINDTGQVNGNFPGMATILYIVSNVCSVDTATHSMYINLPGQCATGVNDISGAGGGGVRAYPNPTNGNLTIETPANGTIVISTIDGRQVLQYNVKAGVAHITLPSGLPNGVYICRFNGADGTTTTTKIVYEP